MVKLGLVWLGINANIASTIALVYHFITLTPVLIIGIIFMWYEGLRWDKIKQMT